MKQPIYLDYAAATPIDPEVLKAMTPFFVDDFYNPSATYLAGRRARLELESARAAVAGALGVRPAEIVFTAGATEANNLAIQGLLKRYPEGEILVSSVEHESVLEPAKLFNHQLIPVDGQGRIILDKLSNLLTDKTVLVGVMLVNNEIGTVQPLREIAGLLAEVRRRRLAAGNKLPLYLHTDAAQAGNYLDLYASRLGVDMMSLNGGKLYGPKQSGALYIKGGIEISPLIVGGGQEFGLRSGTENLAAAAGLAAALQAAQQGRAAEALRVAGLRRFFEEELSKRLPAAEVNGSPKHQAPHIISLTIPGFDNERLMMQLDEAGIQCAVGSACSAARQEASHVLSAIGLDDTSARSTLRFSLGRQTTRADIAKTVKELVRLTELNR